MKKITTIGIALGVSMFAMGAGTAANAACTGITDHNWASQFDGILSSSRGFQHPSTSFCIFYSSQSKRDQQVPGVLYPEGSKMVIAADEPGSVGARSELRSHALPNNTSTTYVLKGKANIPGGQNTAQFTIGQLFGLDRNNSGRPVVRIEFNKGQMRAAIKESLGSNDNTTFYQSSNSGRRNVFAGEVIDYEISQKRVNTNDIDLVVKIEGETLFDGRIYAKTGSDNYFKLGCYVNNSSDVNKCIAKFSTATISPGLSG